MKPALAILTTCLLLASAATAQPGSSGPPPTFKVVSAADKTKGLIEFIETTTRVTPVQKEVIKKVVVVEDGVQLNQLVKEIVTVNVPVTEQRVVTIDAATARVITPDGKQLPIDEVWKRLTKDTVVLVSSDGNTPGQAYLKALSPETLVIIAPQMKGNAAPPIVAPPPVPKVAPPEKINPPNQK